MYFIETIIARRIIQIGITFDGISYVITPMDPYGIGNKSGYSTDIEMNLSGNTYVCDYDDNNMQKILSNYTFILKWEPFGTGKFIFSTDVTEMNSSENQHIADFGMMEGKITPRQN